MLMLWPDEAGIEDVGFEELADHEDDEDDAHEQPVRRELHRGNPHREHEAGDEAQERHEAEEPGNQADHEAEIEAGQRQRGRVVDAQHQHDAALPADDAGHGAVDLIEDGAHLAPVLARQQVIDARDHRLPVEQQVEGHDRRQKQHRDGVDDREAALGHLRGQVADKLDTRAEELRQGRLELARRGHARATR